MPLVRSFDKNKYIISVLIKICRFRGYFFAPIRFRPLSWRIAWAFRRAAPWFFLIAAVTFGGGQCCRLVWSGRESGAGSLSVGGCFVGQPLYFFLKSVGGKRHGLVSCPTAASGCFFVKNTVKIRKICPPKAKFLCRILSERARTKSVNLQNEYLCKNTW